MASLEQWMLHNLSVEDIIDISEYGVNEDTPLVGKCKCTSLLYEMFHEEIWDAVIDEWKCLDIFVGSKGIKTAWDFELLMAWEAVKITARKIASEDI